MRWDLDPAWTTWKIESEQTDMFSEVEVVTMYPLAGMGFPYLLLKSYKLYAHLG